MAMLADLEKRLGFITEKFHPLTAVRVMATAARKISAGPFRVFLAFHGMHTGTKPADYMRACSQILFRMAFNADVVYLMQQLRRIIGRMGPVACQALARCYRGMDILFRKACLVMAVKTELGRRRLEQLFIIGFMGGMTARTHTSSHR